MADIKVPTRLQHEPLIDALFEVRFEQAEQLGDILPGALFQKLTPKPILTRLPAAEFPQPLRAANPDLHFASTHRLDWNSYTISIGDRNVTVGCKLPYPKWAQFKINILNLMRNIGDFGVLGRVERYSLKYTNLIEAPTVLEQIGKIDLEMRLGDLTIKDENIDIKLHQIDGDTIHILTVITSALTKLQDGTEKFGAIVDVDSIVNIIPCGFDVFIESLDTKVERLRQLNKKRFFASLKQETIDEMGPSYE